MLAAFGLVVWVINKYVIDIEGIKQALFPNLPNWMLVMVLFLSECCIGLLPPDIFILWARSLENPYFMVLILATASYAGGVISWYVGTRLHRLKTVKQWVHIRFAEQVKLFKKYGGLVIFVSALTPLPFSPVSVIAGMVQYPRRLYLLVALSRFLRFFLYAYVFYKLM